VTAAANSDFVSAKRAEIDRLEALARELLEAHPAPTTAPKPGSVDDLVEAGWRELAYASRQLRPLLEALERANAGEPGFETYRAGFDFRLTEAMATVGTMCSFLRLQTLRQRKTGRNPRPNAESPFTTFIKARLKRNPNATAEDIRAALVDEARDGESGDFKLSKDQLTILTMVEPPRTLKVSGVAAKVWKVRNAPARKEFPLTG
jgi:hypothetical protein